MHAVHDYSTSWILQAIKTAVDICNRSRQTTLKGGILNEVWSSKSALRDHLHIFGYDAFVPIKHKLKNKLDVKSTKGIFLGYIAEGESGYKIWLLSLNCCLY